VSAGRRMEARRLSRRRFVALVAATSAAVVAAPAGAAVARRKRVPAPAARPAPAESTATAPPAGAWQKEFERQKKSTLSTLKTLRDYPLPPGGDLAVVFRPLRAGRKPR